MTFKFHPFSNISAADTTRISKELHKLVNEEILMRYVKYVIDETYAGNDISLEIMFAGERPYAVRIFNSTRHYDKDARISIIISYRLPKGLENIGVLSIHGIFCAESEEEI